MEGFTLNNNTYSITVSADTQTFEMNEYVNMKKISWVLSYDDKGENKVSLNKCVLEYGENNFYITFKYSKKEQKTFKVNIYRLSVFTVEFVTGCETEIANVSIEENKILTQPVETLEKIGFLLTGWDYDFSEPVTSDLVITATWIKKEYVITYDANIGNVLNDNTIVFYGEAFELEIPTKEGHEFLGWKYQKEAFTDDNIWMIDADITIVAEWKMVETEFDIIYVFFGGSGSNLAKKYSNMESLVLGVPYRHNCYFDGWYKESNFSGSRVHVIPEGTNGNIRLWAKWVPFTLEGANIGFLGDSITTFYNEASPVNSLYSGTNQFYYPLYSTTVKQVSQTWWYKVIEQTKTKLVANDSWSGSSCHNNGSTTNSGAMNLIRINNLQGADIVVVFIGTNDNVNGYVSQFAPSYTTMIENIKKVCPDAFIFCCLMGYSAYDGYFYTEANRLDFNETIKTIASAQGCYIIDFSMVQTKDNYSTILGDRLHLSANGMIAYSEKAIAEIKYFLGGM